MPNWKRRLHVVGQRQDFLSGNYRYNIQGFDYEDKESGLEINVREPHENEEFEIRLLGKLVKLKDLKEWLAKYEYKE